MHRRITRLTIGCLVGFIVSGWFAFTGHAKPTRKYKLREYTPKAGDTYLVSIKHTERWNSTLANGKNVMTLRHSYVMKYRETVLATYKGWVSKMRRKYARCWFRHYEYDMKQGKTVNKRKRCVYHNKTVVIDGFGELAGISHNSKPLYGPGVYLLEAEMKARAKYQNIDSY